MSVADDFADVARLRFGRLKAGRCIGRRLETDKETEAIVDDLVGRTRERIGSGQQVDRLMSRTVDKNKRINIVSPDSIPVGIEEKV